MVADINDGGGSSAPTELMYVNGIFYFNAFLPDSGVELWSSDGTSAGTAMVADVHNGTVLGTVMMNDLMPWDFRVADSSLYFITPNTTFEQGRAIYVTNGTSCGTREVKFPSSASWPESLASSGNKIYGSAIFKKYRARTNGD